VSKDQKPNVSEAKKRSQSTFSRGKRWQHIDDMSGRTSYMVGPGAYDLSLPRRGGSNVALRPDTAVPIHIDKNLELLYFGDPVTKKNKMVSLIRAESLPKPRFTSLNRRSAGQRATVEEREDENQKRDQSLANGSVTERQYLSEVEPKEAYFKPAWRIPEKLKPFNERVNSMSSFTARQTREREQTSMVTWQEVQEKPTIKKVEKEWLLSDANPYVQALKHKKTKIQLKKLLPGANTDRPKLWERKSENVLKDEKSSTLKIGDKPISIKKNNIKPEKRKESAPFEESRINLYHL